MTRQLLEPKWDHPKNIRKPTEVIGNLTIDTSHYAAGVHGTIKLGNQEKEYKYTTYLTQEEQDAMVERLAKPLTPFQSPERPQPTIRKYSLTNGKLQVQLAPVPTMGAKEYDTKMSDKYADQVASKQKALDALKDLYYQPLVPKVERSKDYIAKVCAAMYAGNSAKDVQV